MVGWLECDSIFPSDPASTPCLRNWSINWRKSCSSFSCKFKHIYKSNFLFKWNWSTQLTLCSAVMVSDCKRLVMLANDCSKAATTWA
jgi:hypothetical protein